MIKRIELLVVILPILALGFYIPVFAADAGPGVIKGKLINITANSKSSLANIEMTLQNYLNGAQKDSSKTKTDANGNYVFNGLSTDAKYSYEITTTYQEADYQSGTITFAKDETTKSVDLTVYDSTTEDMLKVDIVHTLVTLGEGSLKIREFLTINNITDKTYVGSKIIPADPTKKETIRFSLPQGATNVSYDSGLMGCCAFSGGNGFVYGMAVFPGKQDVVYSYEIPYKTTEIAFNERFEYPTAQYNFLIQGEGVTASSDQLSVGQPLNIEGKKYGVLSALDFTSGKTVTVKLAGLTPASNQNTILYAGMAVVVLGCGALGLYTLRKRKLQTVSPRAGGGIPSRQRLLLEIASLDDDFEAGKIPESQYRSVRARMKAQLLTTKRQK